jgi:hypothetical protein
MIADANEYSEDERSIANRLANEEKSEDDAGRTSTKGPKAKESKLAEDDPTAPVCSFLTCFRGSHDPGQLCVIALGQSRLGLSLSN